MKIFIVESPAKIKTLKRLFSHCKERIYFVATLGHIKDLPVKKLGVDPASFEPHFYFLPGKKKLVEKIKELLPRASEIYLATDPDREGEAISFHLYEHLRALKPENSFKRIELIEITKEGLKKALSSPRKVRPELYEAWKTRRVLDRLVGYLISPVLSKNFKARLSAGRVQSVALRLIVEREREIRKFVPQVYYTLKAILKDPLHGLEIETELYFKNKLLKASNKEEVIKQFQENFSDKVLLVKVKQKEEREYPPHPLKTTTMIEYAQKFLGFEPKETMYFAQKLYEAGYITYMRTDSVRVSESARRKAKKLITEWFGEEYVGRARRGGQGRFVQDAHECIRPTRPEMESVLLFPQARALYQLIRAVFLASQMAPAKYLVLELYFKPEDKAQKRASLFLKGKLKSLMFPGYLALLKGEKPAPELPSFEEGRVFEIKKWEAKEYKTSPPEHYTPSSLIKKLESLGIGRPSTYATLLDLLYRRKYVKRQKGRLIPTELGEKVCGFLMEHFPEFVDYEFTAQMEDFLEKVLSQEKTYLEIIEAIYKKLKK